ncbi:MAG TPA: hypothetical protein VES67_26260 [Vicinamibacterales bacterium]|nr:hypothetical protein [Vicinamibacterales bacterium]
MTEQQMFYAHWGSIVVALALVLMCWRWRPVGRLFFVLLFLVAAQFNFRLALTHPEVYVGFAPLAYLESYRDFILGSFARHTTVIVWAIAVGQVVIGVLVLLSGRPLKLGLVGAIVFLIAVAPLGTGAGFPATLILAWAAALLLMGRDRPLHAELAGFWQGRVPLRPPTSGLPVR